MGALKDLAFRLADDLYAMLPHRWRDNDHSELTVRDSSGTEIGDWKFMRRFLGAYSAPYDSILDKLRNVLDWFDSTKAPVTLPPYIAANHGWQLDRTLSIGAQRLLTRRIFDTLYKGKGTAASIRDAVAAITRLPVNVWSLNAGPDLFEFDDDDFFTSFPSGQLTARETSMLIPGALPVSGIRAGSTMLLPGPSGDLVTMTIASAVAQPDGLEVTFTEAIPFTLSAGSQASRRQSSGLNSDCGGFDSAAFFGVEHNPFLISFDGDDLGDAFDGLAEFGDIDEQPSCNGMDRYNRFTLVVEFQREPTADQLAQARRMCEFMRPGRVHVVYTWLDVAADLEFEFDSSPLDEEFYFAEV